MIVDDALGQAAGVELRDGVKLDPTTRTAAEGALFNVETWAAGTTFPYAWSWSCLTERVNQKRPCKP